MIKRFISASLILIILSVGLLLTACGSKSKVNESGENIAGEQTEKRIQHALELLDMLNKGEYSSVFNVFDNTMKSALPENKLKETWESTCSQLGGFKKIVGTRTAKQQGYNQVFITCEFGLGNFDVLFVFGQDEKMSGFFIRPTPKDAKIEEYKPISNEILHETEIFIGSGKYKLPGTLTMPRGTSGKKLPVIILVHGSGPNDRDETIFNNKPFRDLAHGLAAHGIATIRYDKRTFAHPDYMPEEGGITVQFEVIDDVLEAIKLAKQTDGIDSSRIFILGHSLGANLLPKIGEQTDDVAGYIAMAGNVTPIYELIPVQYEYIFTLDGKLSEEEQKTLNEVKARMESYLGNESTDAEAEYFRSFKDYNPVNTALALAEPFLFLQGERDYQVPVSEFEKWKTGLSGRKNTDFILYPKLNHLFMEGTGEGKSTPDEYELEQHIPEAVIKDIADWVLAH